jgi:hypothetical protein
VFQAKKAGITLLIDMSDPLACIACRSTSHETNNSEFTVKCSKFTPENESVHVDAFVGLAVELAI